MADHSILGKTGRVTGTIGPGKLGEVMIEIRGGSEAFHAYCADQDETLIKGTRIAVVEYYAPRTVLVTKI